MTGHKCKRRRAIELARKLHGGIWFSPELMADRIPASLWETMRATDLALVLAAVEAGYQRGRLAAEREACLEGAIWDEQRGILREISPYGWDDPRNARSA